MKKPLVSWLCLISVFVISSCSDDMNPEPVEFSLNEAGVSHLYWPFHNPSFPMDGNDNVPSFWEGQAEGQIVNKSKEVTVWRYQNDHQMVDGVPTHHINADWFAQDWNYFEGENSDCGMSFFAPLTGKIIRVDRVCEAGGTDCENPACDALSPHIYGNQIYILHVVNHINFVFRAAHLGHILEEIETNQTIYAGEFIGQIGNEGRSTFAHLHASLWKNIPKDILNALVSGELDMPQDHLLEGSTYAADFLFDAQKE